MTIWAIADIHASPLDDAGQPTKPMEVFGESWAGHVDRIERAWDSLVSESDTVIVAGDLDWSLRLNGAMSTIQRLAGWKGQKLLVRGNHDFWWPSNAANKVRTSLPEGIDLIHNNAFQAEGFNIVGAKGSPVPGSIEWTDANVKLLNRELGRLKLSLEARDPSLPTIAALHYPPFYPSYGSSLYIDLFGACGVRLCVYGHIHGEGARLGPSGDHDGVHYLLTAVDHTDFKPVPIAEDGQILGPEYVPT